MLFDIACIEIARRTYTDAVASADASLLGDLPANDYFKLIDAARARGRPWHVPITVQRQSAIEQRTANQVLEKYTIGYRSLRQPDNSRSDRAIGASLPRSRA